VALGEHIIGVPMARPRHTTARAPVGPLDREAIEEARHLLDVDGAVTVAVDGRVVLCQTLDAVEAALAGQIPTGAVRLDGTRR
jgi:hypothetical protein